MIRYYCQYSYGGFKTYRLKGEAHEELTQVVTTTCDYDFPPLADLYFNQGGAKMLYRFLDENTLALIVKEIPSHGQDTDGRPISCAIQFIGDADDRKQMDRLAINIANDLKKFETFFADLFNLRGGLHFEGDKLDAYVKTFAQPFTVSGASALANISKHNEGVLLYVPFTDNFGKEPNVTAKLLKELQLPANMSPKCVVHYSELMDIQHHLEIKPKETASSTDFLKETIGSLESINRELRKSVVRLTAERDDYKKRCEMLNDKYQKHLRIGGFIICALLIICIIALIR